MSLIDSDTVTYNLVSLTEVRELRRLCVEGARGGYCVCHLSGRIRAKDPTCTTFLVTDRTETTLPRLAAACR